MSDVDGRRGREHREGDSRVGMSRRDLVGVVSGVQVGRVAFVGGHGQLLIPDRDGESSPRAVVIGQRSERHGAKPVHRVKVGRVRLHGCSRQ